MKWLNFYAEDLLAPISRFVRHCERCGRWVLKGYFVETPTKVKGVSDLQIVCWRCAKPRWADWMRLRAAHK